MRKTTTRTHVAGAAGANSRRRQAAQATAAKPRKRPSTRDAKPLYSTQVAQTIQAVPKGSPHATGRPVKLGSVRTALNKPNAKLSTKPNANQSAPRRSRVTGTRSVDLLDPFEPQRLSKIMAAMGLCSRREADYLIEKGWVRVNGKVVQELGVKVLPTVTIDLDAHAKNALGKQVTILYHKPIGVVSGQPEERYKSAAQCIGPDNQFDHKTATPFQPAMLKGLAPAGRLDIDSTGLLVLTQDGRIAKQLIDANSTVEKEYLVRVEGQLGERGLSLLRHGLELDGEPLKPAKVSWQNEDQLRFVLTEGKKRQIRRMCEMVGLKVVGLKRVRIGRMMLGDLPMGQWRLLKVEEQF